MLALVFYVAALVTFALAALTIVPASNVTLAAGLAFYLAGVVVAVVEASPAIKGRRS